MRALPFLAVGVLFTAGCPDVEPECDVDCTGEPEPPRPSGLTGPVVAVGGTATFTVQRPYGDAGALRARVAEGAAEIEAIAGDRVTVRALDAGTATLALALDDGPEITAPVTAKPLGSAQLTPMSPELAGLVGPLGEWAFFAGDDRQVALVLVATDGTVVVDESAEVFADAAVRPLAWLGAYALDHLAAGVVTVEVIAGQGQELTVPVEVVDAATHVHLEGGAADHLTAAQATRLCFRARADATTVLGAPWSFVVDGGAVLGTSAQPPGCVELIGLEPGPATLTARAGGQELALAIAIE